MLAVLMTLSVFVLAPLTANAVDEYGVDKGFGKTVGDYGKYSYDEDGNILMSVTMDKHLLYTENGISYFKGTNPTKITFGGLLPEVLSVGKSILISTMI